MRVTIKTRRDTEANWTSINPTLSLGEMGIETDTKKIKFGDGNTLWNDLQYINAGTAGEVVAEDIDDRISDLLVAGNGISIDYDDANDTLTISNSGINRIEDIIFDESTISTANTDQNMTITTNGGGDIYIGADRNMIFDMNAFTSGGIILQDSQEDGYDNVETPSTLIVGRIFHNQGSMVISSDGSIIDASGVKVDANGVPSENPAYGGVWITNGQDTGFLVPPQTESPAQEYLGSDVEIHNNSNIWEFTPDGNINLPVSGMIVLGNNTTIAEGTFDNGTGGQNGISINCYVGYELNWQGGHLKSTVDGGMTTANILCDSPIEFQGEGMDNVEINNIGITFTDGTTLTSATFDSTDISDFDIAVSGLLPVVDILPGTNITVDSVDGSYTINHNGDASVLKTTVFNKTGVQIPKFKAVYINGGQGDMPTIALASSNGEGTSSKTYAVTAEAIDHMSSGIVVVNGALTGLNTDQFNPTAPTGNVNGTTLWLGTSGNITTTKPTAPYHAVSLGTIVRTHQNEGVVEVKVQNGYEIEELHNVLIDEVADNQILKYDDVTSLWKNDTLLASDINDFNASVSGLLPANIVVSDTTGITGANSISNIVMISQANYDALGSYDPNTIYYIV